MNIVVVIFLFCFFCFERTILIQLLKKIEKTIFVLVKNYLSKIFTVYILILALIPCADICTISTCLTDDKLHIEQSSRADNHCNDLCSPLCICFCCNDITSVSDKFCLSHFTFQSAFKQTEHSLFFYHFLESDSPPPKS